MKKQGMLEYNTKGDVYVIWSLYKLVMVKIFRSYQACLLGLSLTTD
jgi:hypothetical protein